MSTRGIRGAIDVEENTTESILSATRTLLKQILRSNPGLESQDIASIFFTMTPDLTATFPALGARQMGWVDVPLLCYQEIAVTDSLSKILRVLVLWNTDRLQKNIRHVYLGAAVSLRPDLNIEHQAVIVQ